MREVAPVELVLSWPDVDWAEGLRRNAIGFAAIKQLAATSTNSQPLKLNAFLFAFMCSAKNLDLLLEADSTGVRAAVAEISNKMIRLEDFERDGSPIEPVLKERYLAVRHVAARPNTRDEVRTLAVLLFSGPSAAEQIAEELGMSVNLVERCFRVLDPLLDAPDGAAGFAVKTDSDSSAVVLSLVRGRLGLDPLGVLKRLIDAADRGGR